MTRICRWLRARVEQIGLAVIALAAIVRGYVADLFQDDDPEG